MLKDDDIQRLAFAFVMLSLALGLLTIMLLGADL